MKKQLFIILIFLVNSLYVVAQENAQSEHKTYYGLNDFTCQEDSVDCYSKIRQEMLSKNIIVNGKELPNVFAHTEGYSIYNLQKKKTKNIFVYIHGLWGSSAQYYQVNTFVKIKQMYGDHIDNSILLTLPGHYSHFDAIKKRDKKIAKTVNFEDWVRAVDETILLASKLGENVIVLGQSTGGLLALVAAHRHPQIVKKLMLTEPALQVKGHLKTASCDLSGFLSVFNNIAGKVIDGNLSLGCQVSRLAKSFLQEFEGENQIVQIQSMAQSVRVPVLLLNNEEDDVVEEKANRLFYEHLNVEKQYVSLIEMQTGIDHGMAESQLTDKIADQVLELGK